MRRLWTHVPVSACIVWCLPLPPESRVDFCMYTSAALFYRPAGSPMARNMVRSLCIHSACDSENVVGSWIKGPIETGGYPHGCVFDVCVKAS